MGDVLTRWVLHAILAGAAMFGIALFAGGAESSTRESRALQAIRPAAQEHGVSESLLMAMAFVESSYRPWVESSSGALGLLQVKPTTAEWILAKSGRDPRGDLLDPYHNAQVAALYFRYLEDRFGTMGAIQAYNIGPGAYSRGGRAEGYLAKVLENI